MVDTQVMAFVKAGVEKAGELTSAAQVLSVLRVQAAAFPPELVKVGESPRVLYPLAL